MKDNLIDVKVFGAKSGNQEMLINNIKSYFEQAEIPYVLIEETEATIFVEKGIDSQLAVQLNSQEIIPISMNGAGLNKLRKSMTAILTKNNFGKMSKVIVPIDFSETSVNALQYGHKLASDMNAVTKVLHVYSPSKTDLKEAVYVDVDFEKLRENHFNEFIQNIDFDPELDIMKSSLLGSEFKTGFPGEKIIDSVSENNAEMIIMGSTGDSSRIKKWFGSVSTNVMNESPVPVLLVPQGVKYGGIKNVLYAYDDYETDKDCIDEVLSFAKKFDANIHFIHVRKENDNNPGFYIWDLVENKYPLEKIQTLQLEPQSITTAINDYAITHEIDMMVFGTKERNLFQKLVDKSITRKMNFHSSIPLLIVKPEMK